MAFVDHFHFCLLGPGLGRGVLEDECLAPWPV